MCVLLCCEQLTPAVHCEPVLCSVHKPLPFIVLLQCYCYCTNSRIVRESGTSPAHWSFSSTVRTHERAWWRYLYVLLRSRPADAALCGGVFSSSSSVNVYFSGERWAARKKIRSDFSLLGDRDVKPKLFLMAQTVPFTTRVHTLPFHWQQKKQRKTVLPSRSPQETEMPGVQGVFSYHRNRKSGAPLLGPARGVVVRYSTML